MHSFSKVGAGAARLLVGVVALSAALLGGGCGATDGLPTASLQQGLCTAGDGGGDLGCGCTLNSQCNSFDNDTRLIVCDVPTGGTVGVCLDCTAKGAGMRPVGCACSADGDCSTGLKCNGRTCQPLRQRGEYCIRDTDCGSDMLGSMTCLPTKSWCGPLEGGRYCDFNTDCISGHCTLGYCTPGGGGAFCATDADCASPRVCSSITGLCIDKQADGARCSRTVECVNQCNSFSGICLLGGNGVICTLSNPDGVDADCTTGYKCTDCGGSYTCRVPGGPCG